MKVYLVLNELDFEPEVIRDIGCNVMDYFSSLNLFSTKEKAKEDVETCLKTVEEIDEEWDIYEEKRWEDTEYGIRYTNGIYSYLVIEQEVR